GNGDGGFGFSNGSNGDIVGTSANPVEGTIDVVIADVICNDAAADIGCTPKVLNADNVSDNDIDGSFTSNGSNLIGNGDGGFGFSNGSNGDIVGTSANPVDPQLGPLQDNGGPTFTQALLPGSPAIDAGSANGLTTDQRGTGFVRVFGSQADIGAFEVQTPPNTAPAGDIPDQSILAYDAF
ncbi:MAG: choice-of-anchor Q domain-containing protein, partial [Cyanobacteria bacterium J06592_8]